MKLRVGLHEAHEIEEVFLPFAGAASGVAPCEDFALQRVLQTRDAHEDAMHIGSS